MNIGWTRLGWIVGTWVCLCTIPRAQPMLSAQVQMEIVVGPDGQVLFPWVVRTPDRRLGVAPRQAVAKWKFTPPKQDSGAAGSQIILPLTYASSRERASQQYAREVFPYVVDRLAPRVP